MAQLIFNPGTDEATTVELTGESMTIGREADNAIQIDHSSVSTHHAEINNKDGRWILRDLNSSNGSEVNGVAVTETVLNDGDTLKFGTAECIFMASVRPAAESTAALPPPIPRKTGPINEAAQSAQSSIAHRTRNGRPKPLTIAIGCAALALGIPFMLFVMILPFMAANNSSPSGATSSQSTEAAITQQIRSDVTSTLVQNKQGLFNAFHPTGTADQVRVHDVIVDWRNGATRTKLEEVAGFTVIYTIFWEGPIEKDGYTKIRSYFDVDVGRYTASEILATNGMTNGQFNDLMFNIGLQIGHELSR